MKKFLLILVVPLFSTTLSSNVFAQCDVKDAVITIGSTLQVASDCQATFNLTFKLNNNGGNKIVVIQAWKEADYPDYWKCSAAGTSTENKSPKAADLKKNGTGPLPFLDIAFDASTLSVINSADYPGGGVTLGSGYTVSYGVPDAQGYSLVTLNNITVTVPNQVCGEGVTIRADVWSSQGDINSQWTPHCIICNNRYAFNYPVVFATQSCTIPRLYSVTISNINTIQTIVSSWRAYRDIDGDGVLNTSIDVLADDQISNTQTIAPGGVYVYPLSAYTGNNGATINQKIIVAVTTVNLDNTTNALATSGCATLPVSLKNFNAVQRSGKAFLSWETAQENNNDGFEVQRRTSSGNYETIGFVDSKAPDGTGGEYSYSFNDNTALAKGVTYYRLRQLDMDGKATYSEIKAIRAGNSSITVSVYPNPGRGATNIAIPEGAGKMDVSLEDFSGKSIQRWNSIAVRNMQLTNLKPGIYMLRIHLQETGEQVTEKIIIQ